MKKVLSVLAAIASVTMSVPYAQCAAAPAASAGTASAKAGETVEIPISLDGCGGFANLGLEVGYNADVMTLTKVTRTLSEGSVSNSETLDKNPYFIGWDNASNIDYNGVLATMTFTIASDAPAGEYAVTVDYYKGRNGKYEDGDDTNFDEALAPLGLTYKNGSVTVIGDSTPTPTPHVRVSSGGSGRTVARTDSTTDQVYSYIISIPDDITITPDDITVKIGGVTAAKNKSFSEKLGAISGAGNVSFTAAITNIPAGESISGTKCEVIISYLLDGSSKTETTEFTLE